MQPAHEITDLAFPRQVAAAKARGREETINQHLIKLLAFDAPEATRALWRREIEGHLRFLSRMRLKPGARLISARQWREWLYAEPFEGNELGYVDALIQSVDGFARNDRPVEDAHARLKTFHEQLAPALARGETIEVI